MFERGPDGGRNRDSGGDPAAIDFQFSRLYSPPVKHDWRLPAPPECQSDLGIDVKRAEGVGEAHSENNYRARRWGEGARGQRDRMVKLTTFSAFLARNFRCCINSLVSGRAVFIGLPRTIVRCVPYPSE